MIAEPEQPQCKYLISAGQLKMFLACPRRWALHYCSGVPKGTGPALEFGSLSHTCLEEMSVLPKEGWSELWPSHWTGEEPNATQRDRAKCSVLSQAMYRHHPGGAFIAEPTYFYDVPDLDDGGTSFYIKPDGWSDRKVFLDWKSTGARDTKNPWTLKPADNPEGPYLWKDIQFNLYALGLMKRWRTKKIDGLWVYGSKKFNPGGTPKTWTVKQDATLYEAQSFFDRVIRPAALLMNGIRRGIASGDIDSPLLIPHIGESCEYRGNFCDALSQCALAPSPISISTLSLPVI